MVGLQHFLVLSAILFSLGVYIVVSRRNAVAILMGVELILNAASINFVAFSHYTTSSLGGQMFAVFVIVLAAAEAAVALAIVLSIYQQFRTINADEASTLKE
jgi:NADH-quinone oxidoreductase subunit K